jgi:hypothetical protein
MTSVSAGPLLGLFVSEISSPEISLKRGCAKRLFLRFGARRSGCRNNIARLKLDQRVFHRHHVAIVEKHSSGSVKIISPATCSQVLYREMNCALSDFEAQRQTSLAELIIEVLRPVPEALGIEVCHVGDEDLANEVIYGFPLFLAVGMH